MFTILSPLTAEMSTKETVEKSRIRLWRSTLGTLMFAGIFSCEGMTLTSLRPSSSLLSLWHSSVLLIKSNKLFCLQKIGVFFFWGGRGVQKNKHLCGRQHLPTSVMSSLLFFSSFLTLFLFFKIFRGLNPTWNNQTLELGFIQANQITVELGEDLCTYSLSEFILEEFDIGEEDW